MIQSQTRLVLVVLLSSALMEVGSASPTLMKTEAATGVLQEDKVLTQLLSLKFMSELMASRAEPATEDGDKDEDETGVREKFMRRHLALSQRERKAGCRNFFWKTFTSC